MHKEKIEQLEKAMNLKGATAEMKAKFQAAIDKLKAEEKKPEEKPKENNGLTNKVYIVEYDQYGERKRADVRTDGGKAAVKSMLKFGFGVTDFTIIRENNTSGYFKPDIYNVSIVGKSKEKAKKKEEPKSKFKEGDKVNVIWGEDVGRKGFITRVYYDEKSNSHYYEVHGASKNLPDNNLELQTETKAKKEKPEKQAPAVKKAIAEKAQTDNAAEMQALIDNATKSSEAWQHNKVLAEAQKFEALRSKSAQTQDAKGDSKKRLTPTRENLIRWMNNPGGFDLIGIDTYKAGDATADLKIKKEVFWNRFNIHYKH